MAGHPSIAKHPNLDEWIEIAAGGRIIVHTGKVELGQRIYTALAIIAAEELDVDYERIEVRRAETGVDPNEGMTTGSMSMQHSGTAIRLAGATARRRLMELAAERLDVAVDSLEVEDGLVQSRDSNQSVTYWDLMAGKRFGIAVDEAVDIKPPEAHTRVGRTATPKGMAEIVTGRMTYLHDLAMPGLMHARLVRPPHYFARLKGLDAAAVERLSVDGVTVVREGSFLAVAAADEYAAVKAAERLKAAAAWEEGDGLATPELFEALTANERLSFPVAAGGAPVDEAVPELAPPPEDAAVTLSASYEKPYIMHGSMGPSAGCALAEDGRLTVWTHSQGIYALRGALARALEMDEAALHLVFTPAAGCYGHNGADDAAFEAALIARAIPGVPILLKWTRDDEHAWEPYGSATVCALRGSLDGDGNIIDWSHESYGDTFMGRPVPGRYDLPESRLVSTHFREPALDWPVAEPAMGAHIGIHRNLEPLYAIPRPRLVKNLVRGLPLRTSALRSLGAFGNVAALESFMDELAAAAGIDPVEFRLRHLDDERARDVVETLGARMAADRAGAEEGRGAGIAFARYKNVAAYCAVGIEVAVTDEATVRLHRAWIVADAGEVVDPGGLTAQLEGGLIQAASWTLYEQVSWNGGGITSRDWESYPIIRFDNIPEVETVLMERPGLPFLGAGETVAGPTGGAIANAIFAASGLRLRRMPFDADAIRKAALQ
ncbi:MAG: xanthine dehydrogenase family protein molybdopterin-binding subunit [Rhodospirillales bacterium]|nr:MAG: xanthine dehydrogenase family protein molybdopterin-binding subunit [Rhodospirillales bacterium]